jgi:ankyrin repeat protein
MPTTINMPTAIAAALVGCFFLCANAAADDALLLAAKSGQPGAVRSLLAEGHDPKVADADGTTALAWAADVDDLDSAKALIDAGADAAAVNRYGVGAVHVASERGDADMLAVLLKHGAAANSVLPDGETALMTAARTGNASAIKVLLDAGAEVNAAETWKGQTALMWAAAENNADAVKTLVAAGADVNARSKGGEFDALAFAVRAGALDATRALLEAGANVNGETRGGTSMLVLAAMNAHYELAALLLDHGADPNADTQGWTALHQIAWARRWNRGFNLPGPSKTGNLDSLELVNKLLAAGADINARVHSEPYDGRRNVLNRIGATPFLLAAKTCDLPLMRVLLDHGADASITTEEGATAVMVAAGVGLWAPGESPGTPEEGLAAVKLAIEAGGDVNAVDANGETAVHGAVYRGGAVAIIEYLASLGAKLDVVNKEGWTPLIAADGVVRTGSGLKHYPEAAAALRRLLRERGIEPGEPAIEATVAATP